MMSHTQYSWSETANGLARQVRASCAFIKRGVVPLRFVDDSEQPPRLVDDAPLVVGVFGNDNYRDDPKTRREVELVRQRLRDLPEVVEMGFGLSQDGQTWAMLVATDKDRYHTQAGQVFQKEMLKAALEMVVWNSWRQVSGLPPDNALKDDTSPGTPQDWTINS
jgi:hypothetical protein